MRISFVGVGVIGSAWCFFFLSFSHTSSGNFPSNSNVKMFRYAIIGALFVVSVLAAPAAQETAASPPSILEEALDVYASCSGESSVAVCLKLKALRYVDRAARSPDIEIIDGFKIVQTEESKNR